MLQVYRQIGGVIIKTSMIIEAMLAIFLTTLFVLIVAIYMSIIELKENFLSNKIVLKYFFERWTPAITNIQKVNKISALNKLKEDGLEYKISSRTYAKEQALILSNKLLEEVKKNLADYVEKNWITIHLTSLDGNFLLKVEATDSSQDIADIASIRIITQPLTPLNCKKIFFLGSWKWPFSSQTKDMKSVSRKIKKAVYKHLKSKH